MSRQIWMTVVGVKKLPSYIRVSVFLLHLAKGLQVLVYGEPSARNVH